MAKRRRAPHNSHHQKAARRSARKRDLPPGTPVFVGDPQSWQAALHRIDYSPTGCDESAADLDHLQPTGEPDSVRWLDVVGIHDEALITSIGEAFGIHPLTIEDVLNPSSRPKYEMHEGVQFVIARMLTLAGDDPAEPKVAAEQVALVLGDGWLISFQEQPGDVFEAVRTRIRTGGGRVRSFGADYLLHGLLDAVVDRYFDVLVALEEAADDLGTRALDEPPAVIVTEGQRLRGEIAVVRRATIPLRDAVGRLVAAEDEFMSPRTLPFFRDLHDHLVHAIELAEAARDRAQAASELSLAAASHRMNEVMRVLTVVASIFIPLTFIAGIYGMNFENMPELAWPWAYPALLTAMLGTAAGLVIYFRRRDWL